MKFYSIITILIILFTVLLLSTKTYILWSKPCNSLDSTDETTNLNAFTPNYQVNENLIFSVVDQGDHAISADKRGNFVIVWDDGPYQLTYLFRNVLQRNMNWSSFLFAGMNISKIKKN